MHLNSRHVTVAALVVLSLALSLPGFASTAVSHVGVAANPPVCFNCSVTPFATGLV